MAYRYYIVLVTTDKIEEAEKIAEALLNAKLAACINYFNVTSTYWWENKIQKHKEVMLIIKTVKDKLAELMRVVKENHSYSVPEIIALPIVKGNPKYLVWLADTVFEN
jgi:periplasmic divalent cation tolerance protein